MISTISLFIRIITNLIFIVHKSQSITLAFVKNAMKFVMD
jgi:hypothetical protein